MGRFTFYTPNSWRRHFDKDAHCWVPTTLPDKAWAVSQWQKSTHFELYRYGGHKMWWIRVEGGTPPLSNEKSNTNSQHKRRGALSILAKYVALLLLKKQSIQSFFHAQRNFRIRGKQRGTSNSLWHPWNCTCLLWSVTQAILWSSISLYEGRAPPRWSVHEWRSIEPCLSCTHTPFNIIFFRR